jgi:hypothetical protein
VEHIEEELIERYAIAPPQAPLFRGRGKPPRFLQKPAFGARAHAVPLGQGPAGPWWRSVFNELDQMRRLGAAEAAPTLQAQWIRAAQLDGARRHLRSILAFGSLHAPISAGARALWLDRVDGLSHRLGISELCQISQWIAEVTSILAILAQSATHIAKEIFHTKVRLLQSGGRASYAYVKAANVTRSDVYGTDTVGFSSAQAAVQAELTKWKESCWLPSGLPTQRAQCPNGPLLPAFSLRDLDKALLTIFMAYWIGGGPNPPATLLLCILEGEKVASYFTHTNQRY